MRITPRRTLLLATGLAGLAGLAYAWAYTQGYRLPGPDRHPDWPAFPRLTNPRLVVEPVPDFADRYGAHYGFATPRLGYWAEDFSDCYRTNLRAVRRVGYQRTGSDYHGHWNPLWAGGSGNSLGHEPPPEPLFTPSGTEYLALTLGGVTGYFRGEPHRNLDLTARADFYQYNYPGTRRDTLFLRFRGTDYRIFVR